MGTDFFCHMFFTDLLKSSLKLCTVIVSVGGAIFFFCSAVPAHLDYTFLVIVAVILEKLMRVTFCVRVLYFFQERAAAHQVFRTGNATRHRLKCQVLNRKYLLIICAYCFLWSRSTK